MTIAWASKGRRCGTGGIDSIYGMRRRSSHVNQEAVAVDGIGWAGGVRSLVLQKTPAQKRKLAQGLCRHTRMVLVYLSPPPQRPQRPKSRQLTEAGDG
jgi:hypothetical protein